MNVLFKYSYRNLKLNRHRTLAAVIGTIITTLLICFIFSFVESLKHSNYKNTIDKNGLYHAYFPSLNQEQFNSLKNSNNIVSSFEIKTIGYDNIKSENISYDIKILSYDSSVVDKFPIELVRGDYPNDDDEILVPLTVCRKFNYDVGDEIYFDINDKQYIIVGVFDESRNILNQNYNDEWQIFYTLSSKNENVLEYDLFIEYNSPHKAYIYSKTISNENKLKDNFIINYEVINASVGSNNPLVYIFIIIIVSMIMVFGIFAIKNSFSISITERYKQFGMLFSIGATKYQVISCIIMEGIIISILAIPIGLVLSQLVLYFIINLFNKILVSYINFYMYYKISVFSLSLASVVSFITVLLSSYLPTLKMVQISPIELIKSHNSIKLIKKKIQVPKFLSKKYGITGEIAYKNIKRNGNKARTVIDSIVICVALFIGFSALLPSFNSIETCKYDAHMIYENDNFTIEQELYKKIKMIKDEISTDVNVKDYTLLRKYNIMVDDDSLYNSGYKESSSFQNVIMIVSITNSKYIEILKQNNLEFTEDMVILIDDIIINQELVTMVNNQKIEKFLINYFGKKITIKNIISASSDSLFWDDFDFPIIIVSDEMFDTITKDQAVNRLELYIKAKEPKKLNIEQYDDPDIFMAINVYQENLFYYSLEILIVIAMYGFITFLSIVSFTNVFNIIATNMMLRSKELATLKAMGMTNTEFNQMIKLESFLYSFKALAIGIPLGLMLSYVFCKSMKVEYNFPILAIIVVSLFILICVVTIMNYSLKKSEKNVIIDSIKNDNI